MLAVIIFTIFVIPKQVGQPKQHLNLLQAIVLVIAILSMIYAIKTIMYGFTIWSVLIFVIIVVARFLLGIIYDLAARRDGAAAEIDWN